MRKNGNIKYMERRCSLVQHDKVFSLISLYDDQDARDVLRSYTVTLNKALMQYDSCEVGYLSKDTHEMVTHRFKGADGLFFIHLLMPVGMGT